jgi:GNAT superfamily N-acetyltransferase
VIPADQWHEPYMPSAELDAELGAGVVFWGYEQFGALVGVMGFQPVRDVDLIRHAYVLPGQQRQGIGAALLKHLRSASARRMLVGTWAGADWAIRFYRRHGFELVSPERKTALLKALLEHSGATDRDLSRAGQPRVRRGVRWRSYMQEIRPAG